MTPQPLEPLYTLRVAAEMIPFCNASALKHWLKRHQEFPSRVAHMGGRRKQRMLYLSELGLIRQMRVKEIRPARLPGAPRGGNRVRSPSGSRKPA